MAKQHYIIPIFVPHRGCPHDCVFCNQRKITGITDEACRNEISSQKVKETIDTFLQTIPNKNAKIEVAFYGGSFTGISEILQKELLAAAYEYKQTNEIQGIRLSTRPDYINEHILHYLKKFDVTTIELGVQSLDEEVLRLSNRGHSIKDVENATALIKKSNFELGLQMMIGLPGDTVDKIYQTAQSLVKLKPNIVRIYPTLVIKGTALEKMYLSGQYQPLPLNDAVRVCKDLLIVFEKHDIQVIRIGLQPTENILEGKDVVAGPFHPAFRELVEAEIRLEMMEQLMKQISEHPKIITLCMHPSAVSETIGMRRKNINYLKEKYGIKKVQIVQDTQLKRDELIIQEKDEYYYISKQMFYDQIPSIY